MMKIYYLYNVLSLVLRDELSSDTELGLECIKSGDHILAPTNLAIFFANSKNITIIFDTPAEREHYFRAVIASFPVIEAGGGVVTTPRAETLMIFRNNRWDLPKGKQEPGEAIDLCALREVSEECGIEGLTLSHFVHHTYHIYPLGGTMVLKRTSWFAMTHSGEGALEPQLIEGITRVKWVPANELVCYMAETYSTIQDVLMAHAKLQNQPR